MGDSMKVSKSFVKETSAAHLPSKMSTATAALVAYDEPTESSKMVTLVLKQQPSNDNKVLKVRMTLAEVRSLRDALDMALGSNYGYIGVLTS
jgi:hypothetical protein